MNRHYTKRTLSLIALLAAVVQLFAQGPNSSGTYYATADGKKGASLKTALCGIISDHTTLSYKALWECYKTTDVRSDGYIWDMYSNATSYVPGGSAQGHNYSKEGDSYNREHSFPKSWFDDASPMYTDLMHIVPTDGYVNGRRSNYPFGETDSPTYESANSFSKLGPSSISGYTGTVFEPADEYKGDFARIYFYMATCYEDKIASWKSDMLDGTAYPAYAEWALQMLLRWAADDPVSQKEVDRNNAVYSLQGNRNPFVDYPGLEQLVWGDKQDVALDYDSYDAPDPTPNPDPDPDPQPDPDPDPDPTPSGDEQLFTKVTSASGLIVGERYIIVYEGSTDHTPAALTEVSSKGDYRTAADVTIATDGSITTTVNASGKPYELTLGGTTGAYTLYDATAKAYLTLTTNGNKLYNADDTEKDNAKWTITITGGTAHIFNNVYTDREVQYNLSTPRFACYKSTQQDVSLYRNVTPSAISTPTASTSSVTVYTLTGVAVRTAATASEALTGLPKGIYIVDGKKAAIK